MIEVVTDAGCDEDGHVFDGQPVEQTAQVDEPVHHLRDAEAVTEVVERVVAVVLLDAELQTHRRRLAIHFIKYDFAVQYRSLPRIKRRHEYRES